MRWTHQIGGEDNRPHFFDREKSAKRSPKRAKLLGTKRQNELNQFHRADSFGPGDSVQEDSFGPGEI